MMTEVSVQRRPIDDNADICLQNGPVTLVDANGTLVENEYSWHKLANMLYIDQPINTGFSSGTPTANSTAELAPLFANL